jgi:toxin ParE1/3/4
VKQYEVVFSVRAERQLGELYAYIRDNSGLARAEKFVGGIVADCTDLEFFPERGVRRDEIRRGLRIKPYGRRVTIAFTIDLKADTVVIIGVFYGGQNYEAALQDDEDS